MKKIAFTFLMSDGRKLQMVPNEGASECSIAYDNTRIVINPTTRGFSLERASEELRKVISYYV